MSLVCSVVDCNLLLFILKLIKLHPEPKVQSLCSSEPGRVQSLFSVSALSESTLKFCLFQSGSKFHIRIFFITVQPETKGRNKPIYQFNIYFSSHMMSAESESTDPFDLLTFV